MNKTIDKILREQEVLNKQGKYATVNRETGQFLHMLVKLKKPKRVLEVGTSIGYSAVWMASALPKGSTLTCIDRWNERIEIAKDFFKVSKLPITVIEGNALDIIPHLKTKFDIVFLDATKSEYLKYLKAVPLNKGALIIADNTIYPVDRAAKAKDFIDYVTAKGAITIPIGSGLTLLSM